MNHSSLPEVIRAMLKPEFYPHPVSDVTLKQTHTSYVLLAGEFAYKVRKAVRFPFIDCSTVSRRMILCRQEVELNRRLSPDIYLGVVAIDRIAEGFVLGQNGDNHTGAVEFAVKMRRLPENQRLDLRILHGTAAVAEIEQIANIIRKFHVHAPRTNAWAYGAAASIWQLTIDNLIEVERLSRRQSIFAKIAQVEAYNRHFIASHWDLFNRRARDGHVREGHGDLRADAIYLTADGIRIVDCLEFDERLRYVDLANEVAFLAMDIDRLGRPDLSHKLIAHFMDDPDLPVLVSFYKSYRATVRAKVELLRAQQNDYDAAGRQASMSSAERLLDLALKYAAPPRSLLIVCGLSGSGKSTLARALSERLGGLTILNSDVVRKRLAGITATTSAAADFNRGIYSPEFTARVYDSLAEEANRLLKAGQGLILDATFGSRNQRHKLIDKMKGTGIEPLFVECQAAPAVIIERLRQREQQPTRISDANVAVYQAQLEQFETLDEILPAWHEVVDTDRDLNETANQIERRIYKRQYSTFRPGR